MRIKLDNSKKIGDFLLESKDNTYTIYSKKLMLKSLNQCDESLLVNEFATIFADPENVKLYGDGEVWSREKTEQFVQDEIKLWNSGGKLGTFAIYDLESNAFMGGLFLTHAVTDFATVGRGHANAAEMAYVIDQKFWGKGHGTTIAILGKKHIKDVVSMAPAGAAVHDIREIVATVHPDNIASKRVLEKTLKQQEDEQLIKFNGNPRILFFKSFELSKPQTTSQESQMISQPKL